MIKMNISFDENGKMNYNCPANLRGDDLIKMLFTIWEATAKLIQKQLMQLQIEYFRCEEYLQSIEDNKILETVDENHLADLIVEIDRVMNKKLDLQIEYDKRHQILIDLHF